MDRRIAISPKKTIQNKKIQSKRVINNKKDYKIIMNSYKIHIKYTQ